MSVVGSCGTCYSESIVSGYEFEAKLYDPSERAEIMRDVFSKAQILRNQPTLQEEIPDGDVPQMFTIHEDVMDRKPIGVTQFIPEFKSPANSSVSGGNCGFYPSGSLNDSINRTLVVQGVRSDNELCADEFIKTFYVKMLGRPGFGNKEIPVPIGDAWTYANLKGMRQMVDLHGWNGDYKSPDKKIVHVDGVVKIAYQALSAATAPVWRWTFGGGLTAASKIAIAVGGRITYVAFNTSLAQTLTDVDTYLTTTAPPLDVNREELFSNVVAAATTLTITGQPGKRLDVQLFVLDATATAEFCDQALTGTVAVATEVATFSEITAMAGARVPITIPVVAVTTEAGAWNQVVALRDEILDKNPALLDAPGAYMVVAPNVFGLLRLKYANAGFTAFGGVNTAGQVMTSPGGLHWMFSPFGWPIIQGNYLAKDGLYFSHPGNLHMGTDLVSDAYTLKTGYEEKCGDFWFKGGMTMGFQIGNLGEFAGTLTNGSGAYASYHNYQAAGPSVRVFQ